jgi:hypothetical protein
MYEISYYSRPEVRAKPLNSVYHALMVLFGGKCELTRISTDKPRDEFIINYLPGSREGWVWVVVNTIFDELEALKLIQEDSGNFETRETHYVLSSWGKSLAVKLCQTPEEAGREQAETHLKAEKLASAVRTVGSIKDWLNDNIPELVNGVNTAQDVINILTDLLPLLKEISAGSQIQISAVRPVVTREIKLELSVIGTQKEGA